MRTIRNADYGVLDVLPLAIFLRECRRYSIGLLQ